MEILDFRSFVSPLPPQQQVVVPGRNVPTFQVVRWMPPAFGCIKINTDGAVRARTSGASSCGAVFRDFQGVIIEAFCWFLGYDSTPLEAEMRAVILAIDVAYSRGIRRIWLECDSTQTMEYVKDLMTDEDVIPKSLVEDWVVAMEKISRMDVMVTHVYREGNTVADKLADYAIQTKRSSAWDVTPGFVFKEARLDAMGQPYFRPLKL